jgi:hypothetical protein
MFTVDDIVAATKSSNFNKGLSSDRFDCNMLRSSEGLNERIMVEITEAMNIVDIPKYLRLGRLVPLHKTSSKIPVGLDEIRPIVVRSHASKIMEKAILEKINLTCPHMIASKIYQACFKKSKSTAIHSSRLLNEVHCRKKRKFNLLVDLQKAYDSVVDRTIFGNY